MFHRVDVLRLDPLAAAPGRMGARRAQPDQVGAQAVDRRLEAAPGDAVQRRVVQGNPRQPPARLGATAAQCLLFAGPARDEGLRIGVEGQPATDDLGALGRPRLAVEAYIEAETVQQLRTQFTLLRVHRADQHEARRMPVGDAVALDQVDAAGGDVEQQVHQVVRQQVHFVDVEHAAVGPGQHARGKPRAALAESGVQIETADDALLAGAQRQGNELPSGSSSATPRAKVDLAIPRGPSISTPPIAGSTAARHSASFSSSAATTADKG